MCPVRAFAVWWAISRKKVHKLDGFVFRKRIGTNGISVDPTEGLTSQSFLECLRNNLLDISIDPRPYGIHSF
ncbi:hypothetical protein PAXINDRAFT_48163, partial [Paxillus involutus ATCC 200175]